MNSTFKTLLFIAAGFFVWRAFFKNGNAGPSASDIQTTNGSVNTPSGPISLNVGQIGGKIEVFETPGI